MKEVKVKGLAFDKRNNTPVVILEIPNSSLVLPIWIGSCEAFALSLALQKAEFPRPLTHDLMLNIIESFGAIPQELFIDSLEDNTYKAKLILKVNDQKKEIDCRPSDGIVLATKKSIPIFTTEKIIAEGGIRIEDQDQTEEREFKDFVEHLDIDQIRKYFENEEKGEGEGHEGN
ncbi:bifunctional nuclease family protein [Athalassotoga saccharophila]|uniref:bifunctional nuclease family protein n=1 Tax=Athalassotoga saccharophila TaxID=1441386 RepID=UPI001379585C|nr:bifunctional nuclease family protein [Athalassotoga saccharophila]BBJ27262.1 hypothetical protein ATHSA_0130 [Athalassotoga saccharophila]